MFDAKIQTMAINPGYALFDTAIGQCGIVWSNAFVLGTLLPERDTQATRERLIARFPALTETLPPPRIEFAINAITALLMGAGGELREIELDDAAVPPFHRAVYAATREIPPGTTRTYGDIAKRVGDPGAARAVGQALGRNPFPIIVPCHRVIAAGGRLGGFTAQGGVNTKQRMLQIEGAALPPENLSLF